MAINPGRGFLGTWGTQAVGPALDNLLEGFVRQFKASRQGLLEDFKPIIFAIRMHAVFSAIEVCRNPKPEYSSGQSLEELFTMWSQLFWTGSLANIEYDKQEYYKTLEIRVKETIDFDVNEIIKGFFILRVKQFGEIPADLKNQLIEFIYIVRTDAVNKAMQAADEKSTTQTLEEILKELFSGWNPEKVGGKTNS